MVFERKNNLKEVYLNDIAPYISQEIKRLLHKTEHTNIDCLEEIRLRANRPLMIISSNTEWFVDSDGGLTKNWKKAFVVEQRHILKTVELISHNSLYAYQEEIRNGFITIRGGHRIGLSGRTVLEGKNINNIKDISGLNIRISRAIKGCSDRLLQYVMNDRSEILNTLIISPPGCGKTTMLRDLCRNISNGVDKHDLRGHKVGIVDERSEIAACYKGIPQHDVGMRTDVLDGCPKLTGMILMLRSMSPEVIITDEIGNTGDKEAVLKVINAGVRIISTAHGYNISELKTRKEVLELLKRKVFERFLVLDNSNGPGSVAEIIDGITMKHISYVKNHSGKGQKNAV